MDVCKFRLARPFALVAGALLMCTGLTATSVLAAPPPPPAPVACNQVGPPNTQTSVCQLFELGPGPGSPEANITNILSNGTHAGPDWDAIFDANGNVLGGVTGTNTFLRDDVSGDSKSATPDLTTYTSAGSDKNTDLISTWNWGTTNVPAKNDITNAYIRGLIDGSGDLIVWFGAERSTPNGASYIDVELFQDEVALDRDPTVSPCPDSDCKFIGEHTAGDLLVSMNFTNGGALGVVEFRKRNAANTGYDLILTLTGEGCNGSVVNGLATGEACAFNNGAPIAGGPWPNFDSQANVITTLATNAFTEWGINASNALGAGGLCFPTVQVKTRSSPSFTAELKDFALRRFQSCIATVATQIHAGARVGPAHNAADIQTTSVGSPSTIHDLAIVSPSQGGPPPTGTVVFKRFANTSCTGGSTDEAAVTLVTQGDGTTRQESLTHTATTGGLGYKAVYTPALGNGYSGTVTSACEPLTVNIGSSSVNTDIKIGSISGNSVLNKAVAPGITVVDVATVTGTGSGSAVDPTGSVTFKKYTTGNCSGTSSDEIVNINAPDASPTDRIRTAVSAQVITVDSTFVSFKADYSGDLNYSPSTGTVCEPLCSFTGASCP